MEKILLLIITILSFANLSNAQDNDTTDTQNHLGEFFEQYSDSLSDEELSGLYETKPCDTVYIDTTEQIVFSPNEYYIIDGDTIGIILTVEQVQKIDSDLEMLRLFKLLDTQTQDVDEFYISVINDQNEKISILETTLGNVRNQGTEQEEMINSLKRQLKIRQNQMDSYEDQLINDESIIEALKDDVKTQKRQKIGAYAGMGVGGAAFVAILTIFLLR